MRSSREHRLKLIQFFIQFSVTIYPLLHGTKKGRTSTIEQHKFDQCSQGRRRYVEVTLNVTHSESILQEV